MTTLAAVSTIRDDDDLGGHLRATLGWRLTSHARERAAARGITVREVLAVVAACGSSVPRSLRPHRCSAAAP